MSARPRSILICCTLTLLVTTDALAMGKLNREAIAELTGEQSLYQVSAKDAPAEDKRPPPHPETRGLTKRAYQLAADGFKTFVQNQMKFINREKKRNTIDLLQTPGGTSTTEDGDDAVFEYEGNEQTTDYFADLYNNIHGAKRFVERSRVGHVPGQNNRKKIYEGKEGPVMEDASSRMSSFVSSTESSFAGRSKDGSFGDHDDLDQDLAKWQKKADAKHESVIDYVLTNPKESSRSRSSAQFYAPEIGLLSRMQNIGDETENGGSLSSILSAPTPKSSHGGMQRGDKTVSVRSEVLSVESSLVYTYLALVFTWLTTAYYTLGSRPDRNSGVYESSDSSFDPLRSSGSSHHFFSSQIYDVSLWNRVRNPAYYALASVIAHMLLRTLASGYSRYQDTDRDQITIDGDSPEEKEPTNVPTGSRALVNSVTKQSSSINGAFASSHFYENLGYEEGNPYSLYIDDGRKQPWQRFRADFSSSYKRNDMLEKEKDGDGGRSGNIFSSSSWPSLSLAPSGEFGTRKKPLPRMPHQDSVMDEDSDPSQEFVSP